MAGSNYYHSAALSAGVLVSAAPVTLKNISINGVGASSNIVSVYDSATVAGIGSSNLVCSFTTTTTIGTFNYDCQLLKGLVYVSAAGTAADITIVYG